MLFTNTGYGRARTTTAMAMIVFVVHGWASLQASAQQTMKKSEVVHLTDAQEDFFGTVNQCREAFEKVALESAAFDKAENTSKRLGNDPRNIGLKRQMIKDRTAVVFEKMNLLRAATCMRSQLDTRYQGFKQQLDAQIVDASDAVARKQNEGDAEAQFLAQSIKQLEKLEEFLPYLGNEASGESPLTEEEKQKLQDFKHVLEVAEMQMELAKDNSNLQTRRIAVLAEIRIRATQEYMSIRTAMAHARSDQIVFAGIAENDLTYLDVLEDEERLNKMLGRKLVEYEGQGKSTVFRGGYQFGEIEQPVDKGTTISSSRKAIDRIGNKLKKRELQSDTSVATNLNERRD